MTIKHNSNIHKIFTNSLKRFMRFKYSFFQLIVLYVVKNDKGGISGFFFSFYLINRSSFYLIPEMLGSAEHAGVDVCSHLLGNMLVL